MAKMLEKIPFNKAGFKKIKTFTLLFFLCIGLISPLLAKAGLEWLPTKIGNYLLSLVFKILIIISGVLLSLASWLLSWVTSPSFIGVKFTDNPFVTPAWGLVRDLTNMLFVLALIAIGLGTALRIAGYKIQKTLPLLAMMALLINFTPVICGVVIDASTIVMNFFLEGVSFDWATRTWRGMTISLANNVTTEGFWELFGMGIGMVAFNIMAAFVFLIFAFLFAARYIALWTLVILSPLAFFAYVLPVTRRYWSMWWHQFLQWCFVGVVAAFWVYLGYQLMTVSGEIAGMPPPEAEFEGLTALASYMVPLVFLGIGLQQSLVSSAMGAEYAIKGAKWTGGAIVGTGRATALWTRTQTLGRIATTEKGKEFLEALAKREYGYPGFPGTKTWRKAPTWKKVTGTIGAPVTVPLQWVMRQTAKAGLEYGVREEQEITKRLEELKKKFGKDYERAAATAGTISPFDWRGRIAMGRYLAETKGTKALNKLDELFPGYTEDIVRKIARYTPGKLADLVKHKAELIDKEASLGRFLIDKLVAKGKEDEDVKELIKLGVSEAEAIEKAAFKKVVDGMETEDVETLSEKILTHPIVQEMIARYKPKSFIKKIYEERGGKIGEGISVKLGEIGARSLIMTNPSVVRASIYDPIFQSLVGPIRGAETKTEYKILRKLTRSPKLMKYDESLEEARMLKKKIEEAKRKKLPKEEVERTQKSYDELLKAIRAYRKTFTPEEGKLWREIEELKGKVRKPPRRRPPTLPPVPKIVTPPPAGPRVSEERLRLAKELREKSRKQKKRGPTPT